MGGLGLPWESRGCRVHQVTRPTMEPPPQAATSSGRGDICLFPIHCQPLPAAVSPAKVFWEWGALSQAESPSQRRTLCKGSVGTFPPAWQISLG